MASASSLVQSVDDVVRSVALVLGGGWAYFKFVRGRTFAHCADLEVRGEWRNLSGRSAVVVHSSFTNTGLSRLPLEPDARIVHLYGTSEGQWKPPAQVRWTRLLTVRILDGHDWVEPNERLLEDVLLPVPESWAENGEPELWLALQVQAQVWAQRKRFRRRGTRWHATVTLVEHMAGGASDDGEVSK